MLLYPIGIVRLRFGKCDFVSWPADDGHSFEHPAQVRPDVGVEEGPGMVSAERFALLDKEKLRLRPPPRERQGCEGTGQPPTDDDDPAHATTVVAGGGGC